ncbi:MFS transporter [Trebonia kvetii]|uniref:MFS transporter n=1 Tax=Trebonia kvetii TaxID=2480626 RepID=A0A6P2C1U2_9ACTN|nr:MFS transporter [Trebonia kvetii]TVZ03433.1 MFS transporter [Trebonia kvetii]
MTDLSTASRTETGKPRTVSWAPLAVILCGTFVYVLDFFVVNVALPSIQRGLSASPAAIEWVVAGYGLTSAAFLVTGGRLGDHYGRRRAFCIGLAAFTLTSALCAAAPDAGFLVAARLAQGIGAGIMAPNVLSILGTTYAGPDRVRAISAYGIVMGIAAAGGQLLGGVLIDANLAGLGWRVIFWVNVPVGIAAIAAARKWVPESRSGTPGKLDLRGAALFAAALIAIVLPLLDGRAHGWPAWSLASLAAGPVVLVAFAAWLRHEKRRGGQPLLDPSIFAVRAFRTGLTCQLLFWCQQAACYLLLALYLQEGRGLSPIKSGGVFAVLAAGYLATSFRAPALTVKYGRRLLFAGALVAALGNVALLLAVADAGSTGAVAALFPGLFLLGAGQGLCITPLTSTVLSHADASTAGSVSGAMSTAQQVGNAIGVAISGVIFYGLLGAGHGYAVAYGWSIAQMAVLLAGVAALTFIIPKTASRS